MYDPRLPNPPPPPTTPTLFLLPPCHAAQLLRRSGMPQVLRELFLPESPMYHPTHPRTRRGEAPAKGLVLITCTPDNFAYRANLAAKLCPSFQAPLPDGWEVAEAEEGEGGGGPEPLESPVASRAARLKYRPSIRDFNQAYKSGAPSLTSCQCGMLGPEPSPAALQPYAARLWHPVAKANTYRGAWGVASPCTGAI